MRKTIFCGEGWVYFNPDVGTEYAKNHPKRSGECSDAEDIRRSTEMEDLLHAELDRLRTAPPVQMEAVAPRLLEISSAPKDGTHILGLTQWGWREVWYKRDYCDGEYWTDEGDSEPEPTHWAPLPDASPVPSSERSALLKCEEALRDALLFIRNGVELGFIHIPKNDHASETLPKIVAALSQLEEVRNGK